MARAGRVTIDLTAGTAQFVAEMERARGAVGAFGDATKKIGQHGVSGVQATSAALRDLEGKFTTNLRAAERFVATTIGLGNALQTLFPLAGGLAFGGMLYELGTRIAEVVQSFKEMEEAPARIAAAFAGAAQPIEASNGKMRVANDLLANEIAKLEHKPQNLLKLALDEARESAGSLALELHKALEEGLKVLNAKENSPGVTGWFTGQANVDGIKKFATDFQHSIDLINNAAQSRMDTMDPKDAAGRNQVVHDQRIALESAYREAVRHTDDELERRRIIQEQIDGRRPAPASKPGSFIAGSSTNSLESQRYTIADLEGLQRMYRASLQGIGLTFDNGALKGKKQELEAVKPASDATKEFKDKLRELQNQLDQARDKAKYFGDDLAQKVAAGVDKARASIEALNAKRLSEGLSKLTQPQEGQISSLTYQEALAQHAYEQDQQMRQHVLEDIRKNAEEKKQAFELDVKHMTDYVGEMEKLAQKQGELTHSEKLSMADQAHIDANRYLSEAVYGDRDEKFKAQLAAMAAEMRGANAPEKDIASKTELAVSDHALQEKQRGKDMTISDGYKSFFKQLKDNANSAGQNVQEVMSAAFNGIGDQLTAMLSGQKSSWAGFFQSLAGSFAKAGLNSIFGAIGSAASGGGNFFSKLLSGFRADGGSVSSGGAYVVGERGPELFMPSSSGSIVPNHALAGAGAGGYHQTIQVDARGTDPNLTERNVKRAIQQANANAVRSAMMANAELSRRRR